MALGVLAAVLLRSQQEGQRENVLEQSAKTTDRGNRKQSSMDDVYKLLKEHPEDPELLEAMAGLAMSAGNGPYAATYYRMAIRHFLAARQADRAAIAYVNLVQIEPDEVLEARDQMTIASSLERQGLYPTAAEAYVMTANHYPERDEAQTALLRAAQLFHRHLGQTELARTLLQRILQDYPTSHFSEIARERLREVG
jgi:TolA-binding protein